MVSVQLAIESVTATHQLEAAVITLSKCVRPLLLTGSLKPLNKDIGIEQVCTSCSALDFDSSAYLMNFWCLTLIMRNCSDCQRHTIGAVHFVVPNECC